MMVRKLRLWFLWRFWYYLGLPFFKFNCGAEGLANETRCGQICAWAWAKSWYYEEVLDGRL